MLERLEPTAKYARAHEHGGPRRSPPSPSMLVCNTIIPTTIPFHHTTLGLAILSFNPPMDSLPNEIIAAIYNFIDRNDVRNARLVNSRFAILGRKVLFRTVHLRGSKRSVTRLLRITHNPALGHHVERLVLIAATLGQQIRSEIVHQVCSDSVSAEENINRVEEIPPERVLGIQMMCEDDRYSQYFSYTLSLCVVHLPRLRILAVEPEISIAAGPSTPPPSSPESSSPEPGGGGYMASAVQEEALRLLRIFINSSIQTGGNPRVKSLCMSIPIGPEFLDDGSLYAHAAVAFSECDLMFLSFAHLRNGLGSSAKLYRILEAAKRLKYLGIRLEPLFVGKTAISRILAGAHVWRCLSNVRLDGTEFKDTELLHFLRRHVGVIRSLWLVNVMLSTGTWLEVANFLRESIPLEDFMLVGIVGSRDPEFFFGKAQCFGLTNIAQRAKPGESELDRVLRTLGVGVPKAKH